MTEFLLGVLDSTTGRFVVDEETPAAADARNDLDATLGNGSEMGCARPTQLIAEPLRQFSPFKPSVKISGWWHDSFVDGPGRRSVVRFQGCPIRCDGCWVRETHDPDAGTLVNVEPLARAMLDPKHQRDGVTILGGEPFAQPNSLAELVCELRILSPALHIVVYSGFTLEALIRRHDPDICYVLDDIDVLIDGPYVKALASTAGPYTGSGNQRVINLREVR